MSLRYVTGGRQREGAECVPVVETVKDEEVESLP
jgi:hypothetical protein